MTKRWYIVHAYSNFEKKVAESIREKAQATGLGDQAFTWFQMQMIGVGQDDLRASLVDLGRGQRLEGCMGANRHENRSFNATVRGSDVAASSPAR